jgi:hypothetical protein
MRMLGAVLVTAIVTFATSMWARDGRDEKFAKLLWAKCPQLILEPHHPERAFIQFLDGAYIPIRPRPKPAAANN